MEHPLRTSPQQHVRVRAPHRFANPARLAAYAGLAPVNWQSGRTSNTRRARGGNHRLKNAMFVAAFVASQHDPEARAYYLRKRAQGKEHTHNRTALSFGGHLRRWGGPLERGAGLTQKNTGVRWRCLCVDLSACPPLQGRAGTITQAAHALRTHPARISEIERGRDHNHQLATRYQNWLRTHQPPPPPQHHRFDNHRSINAAVICVARRRPNIILAMLETPNPLPTTPDPTRHPRKPTPIGLTTRQGHHPTRHLNMSLGTTSPTEPGRTRHPRP